MSISTMQFQTIGAKAFYPEGPFGAAGQAPLPSFKPGEITAGDGEGEYVYLTFAPVASVTVNQGDWFVWDHTYTAVLSGSNPITAVVYPFGADCGTISYGGNIGGLASPTSGAAPLWSFTFTPGVYGIWVQRAGTALMNVATINAQSKPMNTTVVSGQMNQPSGPLTSSQGVVGAWTAPLSNTFTATTVTGSAILTAVSTSRGYNIGMKITGSGIPSSTVIKDIQGSTVTISNAATASASGVTMTALNSAADVTTTNTSPTLTNVTSISGLYVNQTITGTGIPASTTITAISGNSAPYTITMSANATATANNIAVLGTIYYEGFLRWPYIGVQN